MKCIHLLRRHNIVPYHLLARLAVGCAVASSETDDVFVAQVSGRCITESCFLDADTSKEELIARMIEIEHKNFFIIKNLIKKYLDQI